MLGGEGDDSVGISICWENRGHLSSRQIDEIRTNSKKEFAEKGEADSGEIQKKGKVERRISRWINLVIP